MSHTPGPWHLRIAKVPVDGGIDWAILGLIDGKQMVISEAFNRIGETAWAPAEANAHLISAAPDLLAALEMAEPLLEITRRRRKEAGIEGTALDTVIEMASAAIKKARGEA